jgi:hypothetical protein
MRNRARCRRALREGAGIVAALLGLVLGASPARADCTKDSECKGDRICDKGACVDAKPASACSTDKDCKGDLVCNDGHCASPAAAPPPALPPPAPPPPPLAPAPPPAWSSPPPAPFAPAPPAMPTGERPRPGRVILGGWVGGSFVPGLGSQPAPYHIFGGGVEGGMTIRVSVAPFPGVDGGTWHGANIQVLGGFYGFGNVYANDGAGMVAFSSSIVLGYEILHFSRLDPGGELQQKGIGARAGLRFGFQWDDVIASQSTAGTDPTIGGLFTLVVPTYHARKGRLSAGLLNFAVWTLPGTGIDFFSIGGGGEF